MRAKTIIFLFFIGLCSKAFSQMLNKTIIDTKTQKEILIGKCNRTGLNLGEFSSFFSMEYDNYIVNKNKTDSIVKFKEGVTITIVMGSWCGDSKEQVPRFYKILDNINFKDDDVTLICVDRNKKAENIDVSVYQLTLVPVFVFYRNGVELGRITETPQTTLEMDMLSIIFNK